MSRTGNRRRQKAPRRADRLLNAVNNYGGPRLSAPYSQQTNPRRRSRRLGHDRNANHTKADWQFTAKNARTKLKHLYPAI